MKNFSIAASAILLTLGLAFFAIAVAQRDSRNQLASGLEQRPEYADQVVAPIETVLPGGSTQSLINQDHSSISAQTIESNFRVQGPHGNQLQPNIRDISQLRSPGSQVSTEDASLLKDPDQGVSKSISEPPRMVRTEGFNELGSPNLSRETTITQSAGDGQMSEPFEASSARRNIKKSVEVSDATAFHLDDESNLANQQINGHTVDIDSQVYPQEVKVAGAFEASLQPLPPTTLLPPPSLAASGGLHSNSAPSVMPPALGSPVSNSSVTSGLVESPTSSFATPTASAPSSFANPVSSWPNSSIQANSAERPNVQEISIPSRSNQQQAFNSTATPTVAPQNGFTSQSRSGYSQPVSNNPDIQLASSAPGVRQLDGSQNPSLQIHKRAPEEVQVGHPATFTLLVRNVGTATAYEVVVTDSVPRGTRLSKTNPPAQSRPDGALVWSIGEMAAGSEQVLSVDLIPESEGEIGSVASVTFAAQASVRTVSTQPKLTVHQSTLGKVLLGKPISIQITISNEGTGVARGVSLEEDVPIGLRHPLGATLGVPLGDLVPGQSRTTQLELIASEPGVVQNLLRAISTNSAVAESSVPIEVVAPQLKVTAGGPKLRYLERPATYQLSITNSGTSMASNVEIFAYLPRGMQFNSAINDGEYLADQHAITWGLEELAVGATATTEMTLLPVEEGDYVIRLQARGDGVKSEPFEKPLRIDGQSELAFSIEDDNDPIETDEQTTYLVKLINNGTRVDQDVSLMVELPAGAKVLQVNAPVAYNVTREGIVFEPIPQVKAKDQQAFRFTVQLTQEGMQVVRAHVKSKLRPLAIVKEESTQVYRDN